MYMLRPRSLNRVYGISESQSYRSKFGERERETETEIDRSYQSSSDDDSEQGCFFRLQTEVLP